jgi:hypothetical protein
MFCMRKERKEKIEELESIDMDDKMGEFKDK